MSKHIRVEIGFGLELDKNGRVDDQPYLLTIPEYVARNRSIYVKSLALKFFGFYTFVDTAGAWTNPSGAVAEERGGMIILVLPNTDESKARVEKFCSQLRDLLNQEAVALAITPADFFII